ncbi:alpha/beta hydrolase [Saccharopolyspora erythraea]|uniref:alpha/beta hydrolase n=1 Tax=Saccharopolyspora erythraea TaxID=1836 RepID=UPI001BA5344F
MEADILGEPYRSRTLTFPVRGGGEAVATLVHRAAEPAERDTESAERGAVLYVHGFCDYFFQDHLATHFVERGYDFYALDLRGYGRSMRPGMLPNYVTDLSEHFEELDAAAEVIREAGHSRLVVLGHSTGGLITALWADARPGAVDALVLNSPWLDLSESWFHRTVTTTVNHVLRRVLPKSVVRRGVAPTYAHCLLREHHGEWDYRLDWKPVEAFPIRSAWISAVRRGHARVQRGLSVSAPVLVLHSARSLLHRKQWEPAAMTADTVLDVEQIARWAPKIGPDVTTVAIQDGLHDLALSGPPAREKFFAEIDAWLADR